MRRRLISLSTAFALGAGTLLGALSADAQATLTLTKKRDIRFGDYAADATQGGTVTLSPTADTTTVTGPLIPFGGTIRRGRFQIIGEPRAWVIVTLPSSITIRRGTSVHTMTVDNFTMDRANPVRLNNSGKRNINIGARVTFSADQRRGNYNDENDFTVNVEYQ